MPHPDRQGHGRPAFGAVNMSSVVAQQDKSVATFQSRRRGGVVPRQSLCESVRRGLLHRLTPQPVLPGLFVSSHMEAASSEIQIWPGLSSFHLHTIDNAV